MPHIVAFPGWPPLTLWVPHGSKIETCSDFSENCVKLFVLAAKVIFRCDRLHSSAPLRRELHWLPINERVIFKVLLLIFKGVNNLIPVYLSDFLIKYVSGRENLRSGNEHLLVFHAPNVLLVTVHFVLLDRVSGTPSLSIFVFHLQIKLLFTLVSYCCVLSFMLLYYVYYIWWCCF